MNNVLQCLLLLSAVVFSGAAQPADTPVPAPPAIGAESYLLQDFDSGRLLVEENPDRRLEPASITKVMTAYVVFDAIRRGELTLDEKALISEKAWRNPGVPGWTEGSRMFAEVNSRVSISDLLRGLIVQSGNDAAVALAEHVAGSEEAFVQLMNARAERMGLENTHYRNTTGWPAEDHYTSARDIARLSRALIRDFPEFYRLYSEKQFTFNNIPQNNRNSLLWKDDSVDGIKTGYTQSAGYCLVTSAERDGMRLIAVVLGADSEDARAKYSQSLLNYGFRFFETHRLFDEGAVLQEARIWKGERDRLKLGLKRGAYVTIPRGRYNDLKPVMNVRSTINAPVNKGESLGDLEIRLGGEMIYEQPLVALEAVGRGNIFQRLYDRILFLFE